MALPCGLFCALSQCRQRELGAEKHTREVDAAKPVPIGKAGLFDAHPEKDAGIVDENVEAAESAGDGYLLEASEQDIEFADGKFTVSGTDRSMTFAEIAGAAYFPSDGFPLDILEPGFEEAAFFDPVNFTFPGGCHVAEVERSPRIPASWCSSPTPQSTMSASC
jgi:hypothetical protein